MRSFDWGTRASDSVSRRRAGYLRAFVLRARWSTAQCRGYGKAPVNGATSSLRAGVTPPSGLLLHNWGIQCLEASARVVSGESPVDDGALGVPWLLPGVDLALEGVDVGDASAQALS